MDRIESIILRALMYDDTYTRRVLPFLEPTYFLDRTEKALFEKVKTFIDKYNTLPTKEAVIIELDNTKGIEQDDLDEMVEYLNTLEAEKDDKPHIDWLVEKTEGWCQEKAIHNAVLDVITILEGKDKKRTKGIIPQLLKDALSVTFDPHVGHDYIADASSRYDYYHKKETRLPFHLDYFNKITKNGVPNKTLNVCLAGTGVGKSLFMCDLAAAYLKNNKNVLYITMEMAEERIAERIDANLMDRPLDDLTFMSKEAFERNIKRIGDKSTGKLIIKEYPTAMAHVGHFRFLLDELNLKKEFKPDAIFIDYLNICASSRMKPSGGMYEMVKSIAEELRGLAVDYNVPVWTATQMNRAGYNNTDPDLTNTSESFGLPATADFMFALIYDEKLAHMNQLLVKILKNRYGDLNIRNKENGQIMNRFVVGIDRSKMKLYNVDESAQNDLSDMSDGAGCAPPAAPKGGGGKPAAVDDDTPPWETPASAAAASAAAEPVFEIDEPMPYNAADDDAERRRNSSTYGQSTYKPKQSAYSAGSKPKNKLNNISAG